LRSSSLHIVVDTRNNSEKKRPVDCGDSESESQGLSSASILHTLVCLSTGVLLYVKHR
jgi:hypothetical protein